MSTTGFTPDSIDGSKWDEEKSARMHFLKNRPPAPEIDGEPLTFKPYVYQEYGKSGRAMYHADHDPIVVHSDRERSDYEAKGWTISADPEDWRKAKDERITQAVFQASAEQAFDHKKMSQKAQDEFNAADRANGDDPLIDLPAGRLDKARGTGRKP